MDWERWHGWFFYCNSIIPCVLCTYASSKMKEMAPVVVKNARFDERKSFPRRKCKLKRRTFEIKNSKEKLQSFSAFWAAQVGRRRLLKKIPSKKHMISRALTFHDARRSSAIFKLLSLRRELRENIIFSRWRASKSCKRDFSRIESPRTKILWWSSDKSLGWGEKLIFIQVKTCLRQPSAKSTSGVTSVPWATKPIFKRWKTTRKTLAKKFQSVPKEDSISSPKPCKMSWKSYAFLGPCSSCFAHD